MGLIAASAITANAQIVDTPLKISGDAWPFLESVVMDNNKYAFYNLDGDKCYIYNDNIEIVKEISFSPENHLRINYLSTKWIAYIESQDFTQTLFNDDDKFEYLVEIFDDGNYEVTGFLLMNDEGETLQRVDFPKGFYMDSDPAVLDLGEKMYLVCTLDDDMYNDSYQLFYRINKGGGSGVFTLACDPIKVDASPRMASKSEPITVTFDSDAVTRIEVVSVRGAVEAAFDVEAGAHSAIVDTSRLGKGMYIINVVADGVRSENCKVIIR